MKFIWLVGLLCIQTVIYAEEGRIPVGNGISLHYARSGSATRVIIVPAGFLLERDFNWLAKDCTVISYDMRNRGRSSHVKDSSLIGIDHDVSDLETVRKHFKVKKISIIGWSYLSLVALKYAEAHPPYVDKLILIGAAPIKWDQQFPDSLRFQLKDDPSSMKVIEGAFKEGLNQRDPEAFSRLIFNVLEKPRLVADSSKWRLMNEQWGGHTSLPNEQFENFRRHMGLQFESVKRLQLSEASFRKLRTPVLLLHGTHDALSPMGAGKFWSEVLPNARLIRVKGAGHVPWVEEAELVRREIAVFLKRLL